MNFTPLRICCCNQTSHIFLAMIKYVEVQEDKSHLTLMKKSEVKNKNRSKYGSLKTIPIWKTNEIQKQTLCTWMNANMGSLLLGKLFTSFKLYKCELIIGYSKYTRISNHINWLCILFLPRWYLCGCFCGDFFRDGSWRKQSRMCFKVNQITLWDQSRKCKSVRYF